MVAIPRTRRYWVFQAKPDRYNLAREFKEGHVERWVASSYRNEMAIGDAVYHWRSGRQAALIGWGTIVGDPEEAGDSDWRVPVRYDVRFRKPIPKEHLISSERLVGLQIFRTPRGTNFKLTTLEVEELGSIVREAGETPPTDPLRTADGRYPARSILLLKPGRTVSMIVQAALRLEQSGSKLPFVSPLLNALLGRVIQPNTITPGTMWFLHGILGEALGEVFDESILPPPMHRLQTGHLDDVTISSETLETLETARFWAIYSANTETIGVRHLLGGLLLTISDPDRRRLAELCDPLQPSLEAFADEFVMATVAHFKDDDGMIWQREFRSVLADRSAQVAVGANEKPPQRTAARKKVEFKAVKRRTMGSEKSSERAPSEKAAEAPEKPRPKRSIDRVGAMLRGRLQSDRPFGSDHLQIKWEVASFAHAFALADPTDQQDRATVALGLFGRWGAGKSFFMSEMRRQIQHLADKGKDPTESVEYCSHIEQICFNAWQYKEATLWASLVYHIFDTLQRRFAREQKEKELKALIEQLDISRQRRQEIEALGEDLREKRKKLRNQITKREANLQAEVEKDLKEIDDEFLRLLKHKKVRESLLETLRQAADLFGLDASRLELVRGQAKTTARQLIDVIDTSGAAARDSDLLVRGFLRSVFSSGTAVIIVGFLALLLVVSEAPEGADSWINRLDNLSKIAVFLTSIFASIGSRMRKAIQLMRQIKKAESELRDNIRLESEAKDRRLAELRAENDQVLRELEDLRSRKNAIDVEIRSIEAELDKLGTTQSLVDFINERASSDDYRKHLGLLALIRKDFETLSELMTRRDADGRPLPADQVADHKSRNTETTEAAPSEQPQEPPKIYRIILYIDDLDRVNDSTRVLEVMEAVHLLLSLPLFNVVVAVDEWWAAHSVQENYGEYFLSGNGEGPPIVDNPRRATPREFLEKVFQICFWVRPLGQSLSERLIDGTVRSVPSETSAIEVLASVGDDGKGLPQRKGTESVSCTARPSSAGPVLAAAVVNEDSPQDPATVTDATVTKSTTGAGIADVAEPSDPSQSESPFPDVFIDPSAFDMSTEEIATMKALARIVGRSPRTLKRFINTYRLLKVMLIAEEEQRRESETLAEHSLVAAKGLIEEAHLSIMFLLAIQIGMPDVAVRVFEAIDKELSVDDSQPLSEMLEKLAAMDLQSSDPTEGAHWSQAMGALRAVARTYTSLGLERTPIAELDPWLLYTARFGFEEWEPRAVRLWY